MECRLPLLAAWFSITASRLSITCWPGQNLILSTYPAFGILATSRKDAVSSSICNQGLSQAIAL